MILVISELTKIKLNYEIVFQVENQLHLIQPFCFKTLYFS
jgi:hypothetical protein